MENISKKVAVVIFAAGKSSRMGTNRSKMIEIVERDGEKKPMILFTTEIFKTLQLKTIILIGYDGSSVENIFTKEDKNDLFSFLRVSLDDGSDLQPNTAGTLRKYYSEIIAQIEGIDNILFCIGDQPFMQLETIRDFINRHLESDADASILLADVTGTPMETSTSTRVSIIGTGNMSFETPPKEGPFEHYSPLADVGVVMMGKSAFISSVENIGVDIVFSKLLCNLPSEFNKVNAVKALNPYQFINVNEIGSALLDIPERLYPPTEDQLSNRFVDKSEILLKWLEWNIIFERRREFSVFNFPETYSPEFEMDTSLFCIGTPACAADCTYRQKHMKLFLNLETGKYIVNKAKKLGFSGVLFSGGGENLEEESYENFLGILKAAKLAGLNTNLATNGVNLNPIRIQELIFVLDSIRFSMPPKTKNYSHLGVIAPNINLARKLISQQYLSTKIYVNFLMTPSMPIEDLEASILLVSQLGVDGIRFKAQHEYHNGHFIIRPEAYKNHIGAIHAISQDKNLRLPIITISKLEQMINESVGIRPFKACWYRDFNPLVVGCDGYNYACCEMKYEHEFNYGQIDPRKDNLRELVKIKLKPQEILTDYCFKGCKGYLLNIDLQNLLNEYETKGNSMFGDPKNLLIRDRVLDNLVRTVLTN